MDKPSDKYWVFCIYLILALTTFGGYWQVHSYRFLNYDDAVATAEKALKLVPSSNRKLAEEIRNRLRLYKAGQPYVQPQPKTLSD